MLQSSIQRNGSSLNLIQKISEIDSNQLEFESVIGKGSFGQVWKGKWRQTQVAIKQIKQEIIDEQSKILRKTKLLIKSRIYFQFIKMRFSNHLF